MKKLNLIGHIFGQLTVIDIAPSKHGLSQWVCKCTCGNTSTVPGNSLKRGTTVSCGCYRKVVSKLNAEARFTTHGDNNTRLYSIYLGMRKRCYTPSTFAYQHYGAKGIRVSPEWDSYADFKAWALINGYTDALSLDRIDGTLDYSPSNCRWASSTTQARNKKKTTRQTSSSFIGVSWNVAKAKWVAYITIQRKTFIVGYFYDEVLAAQARDSYIKEKGLTHFKLNF